MSTFTARQSDASQDDVGSRILTHVLLFFETLFLSLSVAGAIIFAFRWSNPQSLVHLGKSFAFLAGSSVLTLLSSVVVVVRRLKGFERMWHLLFHLPFSLVMSFLGYTALQESSYAFLNIFARAASLVLGIPFVHIILDTIYDNMMLALKGGQAGLFFLDCLWRWINALISAICVIRWRRSQGSAQTFEMAPNLDNVKIWFSDMVHTQHGVQVWPNDESAEESKTLLSHEDNLV